MQLKEYYNSKMKFQLSKLRNKNSKHNYLIWRMTQEQIEYAEQLGYNVIPYLYAIKTKCFPTPNKLKYSILKEIHYKNKDGRWEYVRKLTANEMKILEEYNIKYYVAKYKVSAI